jgi:hypothetical protein
MATEIQCRVCRKPVKRRSDLVVAGKSFHAFHRGCFEGGQGGWTVWAAGPPINGPSFFVGLAAIAALWFGLPAFVDAVDPHELHLLLGFGIGLLVVARLLSWVLVERNVPRG